MLFLSNLLKSYFFSASNVLDKPEGTPKKEIDKKTKLQM